MNASSLVRMIYVSRPKVSTPEEYETILESSRRNNARDYISGALVWREDFNIQVLEGPRSSVSACFMRIASDPRHKDIHLVACTDVSHRLFAEWHMHSIQPVATHAVILNRYTVIGKFDPYSLSQAAAEDLAKSLSDNEAKQRKAAG